MKVIGLTGGIGTGKTTAAEYLVHKGFAHIDADEISRKLTADGQPILEIIRDEFGCVEDGADTGNGLVLNRRALADAVFNDLEKRRRFDSIIHAEIIKEIDRQIEMYRNAKTEGSDGRPAGILLDAPLLFEAGINNRCDAVILITADIQTRIQRVMTRDNVTETAVRDRIRNQMSDEEKRNLADYVVDNSGDPEEMYAGLDAVIKKIEE